MTAMMEYVSTGAELKVFGSSGHNQMQQTTLGASDSQPTLSRFYRSLSSYSAASSDTETDDVLENSSRRHSQSFFLENSSSDDEASTMETRTFVQHTYTDAHKASYLASIQRADTESSKPSASGSMEFGRLLRMMFQREGASCVSQDRPSHHGSLGSFVIPKGSFGSDVVPHVSSFG